MRNFKGESPSGSIVVEVRGASAATAATTKAKGSAVSTRKIPVDVNEKWKTAISADRINIRILIICETVGEKNENLCLCLW